MAIYRTIKQFETSRQKREGGGFLVRRPIGDKIGICDPLLMLDHLGPVVYGPGEAVGAPDHPHRGFETVTYIIDGKKRIIHVFCLCSFSFDWEIVGVSLVFCFAPNTRHNHHYLHHMQSMIIIMIMIMIMVMIVVISIIVIIFIILIIALIIVTVLLSSSS